MSKRLAYYMFLFMTALLVSGCAPKIRIMATESLLEENRMERLALLGEGGVRWMGAGHRPDMEASKKSLEVVLGAIEQELEVKGYDMAFSRPARIVFGLSKEDFIAQRFMTKQALIRLPREALVKDGKYKVYENYIKDRSARLELSLDDPAYEYPFDEEEDELVKAANRVLDKSGCLTGTQTASEECLGLKADMLTIHNTTGADTICIVDVSGLYQTPQSKALMGALSVLTILTLTPVPPPPDLSTLSFRCMEAKTGKMLWWHIRGYPVAASNTHIKNRLAIAFLSFLPDAGSPFEAKCSAINKDKICRPADEDTPDEDTARQCAGNFPTAPLWKCGIRQFYPEPGSVVKQRQVTEVKPPQEGQQAKAKPARQSRVAGRYWFIGLGANSTKLSVDQPAFANISGTGFHLSGGLTYGRFSFGASMSAFDFTSLAATEDTYYPVDEASYSYFSFDKNLDILHIDAAKWTPWVALEWSLQDYGLSNYVYSKFGSCSTLAVGVDVRMAKWLLLRAGYRKCSFIADGSYPIGTGRTDVENITLDMVFRFRIY